MTGSNPQPGHVPPHDLDAEAAVLSALFLDDDEGSYWDAAQSVLRDETRFYSPANRRIWQAITALRAVGTPIDTVTVATWLKERERLAEIGGVPYLARIVDAAPATRNVANYALAVARAAMTREVIRTCQAIAADGYSDVGDVAEWHARAVAEIERAGDILGSKTTTELIGDTMKAELRRIEQNARDNVAPKAIPTGIPALDDKLLISPGDLIVVGARPGQGKSAFAEGTAVHAGERDLWAQEQAAAWHDEVPESLVFSLEMPKEQLALRALCAKGRVDLRNLRRGLLSPSDWSRLVPAAQDLQVTRTWVDDRAGISLAQVRSTVRKQAKSAKATRYEDGKRGRLALVVIDYLQLMRVRSDKGVSRSEAIGEVSRGLKNLAKEEDIAVILLSQLNRAVEQRPNKRPMLSDLRDSGEIEQDADAVAFLYRDEYYNRDTRLKGVAEVLIEKQRNGPGAQRVLCRWEGAYTLLSELSPSEREQLEREAQQEEQRPAGRSKRGFL